MNDQLESELRTSLRDRASLVPAASVERLTRVDYHPRGSRFRPPVAIGATAIAAAASGAAVLVISLGAGASNAFAGWTPKPTPPAPGQVQAAEASCESGQSPIAGLPLMLADTRGPFTFSVYGDNETSSTCIKGPSFTAVATSESSMPVSVPAGQILLSSAHPPSHASQPYSFADGRTGDGVSGVTLVLSDGRAVQATVGNGWFVAWWPGGQGVKSAQLTTPAGVKTQTFNMLPGLPGPAGSAAGSESSGGSASSIGPGARGGGESMQSFGGSSVSP
ncbi:MAG: hypothetical protein WCD11_14290 [Solirubrobacteraceae bacterium]